jgi:hypothetical protein
VSGTGRVRTSETEAEGKVCSEGGCLEGHGFMRRVLCGGPVLCCSRAKKHGGGDRSSVVVSSSSDYLLVTSAGFGSEGYRWRQHHVKKRWSRLDSDRVHHSIDRLTCDCGSDLQVSIIVR